ncbi:MAG TPA: formimidoylglutamate deiminase [Ktedonobacteraceae bacterium]|jgi:formimidoylglutamate deiminase|nr:formimidoylglutamate deiminase [Ktedonobacteraceae bacterium]
MKYLVPEYIYTPQGLQAGMIISISDEGFIVDVKNAPESFLDSSEIEMLPAIALLPGFVNAHSHVFQRALRGHTHRPLSRQDTFWTWRHAMYAQAQRLNPDLLYSQALSTYREMLAAGYTSVGEFHYVHHQPGGWPYANPNAMAEAILQAGHDARIRVVLLMTAYAQSGFNQPPEESQRRFCDASVEAFLERVEALRVTGIPIGIAPHSVRAVPASWFRSIVEYCRSYHLPVHIHADEQVAEIEQCQAAYGCTPIELLERFGALDSLTTIVHATHANATEIELLARYGCTVCVCPTTEGDLGDGIAPYAELLAAQIPLAIGSDSNTRLDPIEELRWAEYTARMRYQRRRVLVSGEMTSPGPLLLTYGTQSGATSLGLTAGTIAPGMSADFIAINLKHPSLAGWTPEDLLDVLFFGAAADVIKQVWVQGNSVKIG